MMDKKLVEGVAVPFRDILKEAYETWEHKDKYEYREFERCCVWPWLSNLRMFKSGEWGYYTHVHIGTFLPQPRKLIKYYVVNKVRLDRGEIDREKYKQLQVPIVRLIRKLGMNPYKKIKGKKWVKISTTKKVLRDGL